MPGELPRKLEDQREQLLKFIELKHPQGSSNNQVTVVFDGQVGFLNDRQSLGTKVIFSEGESADQCIKRFVSDASYKKSIVVVTDDRDIQYAVRANGAKVLKVQDFLAQGEGGAHTPKAPKKLSSSAEDKITSELEDIWLNKDEREDG